MKKMYYSIREAADLAGLQPHVLRYWETEFSDLRPKKNRAGNRIYRDTDLELILEIKQLLHDNRFTIEGARQELKKRRGDGTIRQDGAKEKLVEDMKGTLREILDLLS
ncbi:MerR family transcriptional regulator [bacterium]|nr:MerR family transcriptional regulator [bacterium]